ncbi:MAG: hypothetical protein Q9160_005097 [Pyrenula sp. 1 TL-2023]
MSFRSEKLALEGVQSSSCVETKPRSSSTIRDTDSGYGTGENTPESSIPHESSLRRLWTSVRLQRFDIPIQNLGSLSNATQRLFRQVRKFFAQRDVKDQLQPLSQDHDVPNFGVVVQGLSPVQLAAVSMLQRKSYQVERQSLCGATIRFETNSDFESQVNQSFASIGGLVCISVAGRKKCYATTVEHIVPASPIFCNGEQLPYQDACVVTEGSASSQGDELEDESFEIDLEAKSSDASIATTSDKNRDPDDATQGSVKSQITNSTAEIDNQWVKLGRLQWSPNSVEAILDWAAIEITDPALLLPNEPSKVLSLTDGYGELKTYVPIEKPIYRSAIILEGEEHTRKGKLSTAPSFLLLPSGKNMTKTYTLKLDDKDALQKGDCGKWVVDADSLELFGHIVGVDAFKEAFVVPMGSILGQMQRHFGADCARLLGRADIEELSKELSKELPKEPSQKLTKEPFKEPSREPSTESSKDLFMEPSQELSKELSKELSRKSSKKSSKGPSKQYPRDLSFTEAELASSIGNYEPPCRVVKRSVMDSGYASMDTSPQGYS